MNQHPIPQNIMDVEFKLVGNLTLKQFAYCLVGGGIAILAFTSPLSIFIKIPVMIFFGFLGFGLAFIPLDDRGLDIWLYNYIRAIYKPQRRIWLRQPELPAYLTLDLTKPRTTKVLVDHRLEKYLANEGEDERDEALESNLSQINSLIQSETKGNLPQSIPSGQGQIQVLQKTQIPTITTKVIEKERGTLAGRINFNQGPVMRVAEKNGETFFKPTITNIKPNRPTVPEGFQQHPNPIATAPKVVRKIVPVERSGPEVPETQADSLERNRALLAEIKSVIASLTAYNSMGSKPIVDPLLLSKSAQVLYAQSGKGNLVKQLSTTEQKNARGKVQPRVPVPPAEMVPASPQTAAINQITQQNEQILKELEHARKTLINLQKPSVVSTPPPAVAETPVATEQVLKPETFIPPTPTKPEAEILTAKLLSEKDSLEAPVSQSLGTAIPTPYSLSVKPNIIMGRLTDPAGNPINQAIVMIKDSDGIPQWAMRSDLGGEFKMSNPLANGSYAIHAQKPGYSFEEMKVTLSGTVLDGINITGSIVTKA